MKKICLFLIFLLFLTMLPGCTQTQAYTQIAATTLPVYDFTTQLCGGTGLSVTRLVTESVSCLHDYTLQVAQIRAIEAAEVVVISGAELESFLDDVLDNADNLIDASTGISLICGGHEHAHDHGQEETEAHAGHTHENDPHIWLSPANAKIMAENICSGLTEQFPEFEETFQRNLTDLLADLDALQAYGTQQLSSLSCRELITFHDGFSYLAQDFDLTILKAVEEESGSEASAADLIELIEMTEHHKLPAIFTESNGSTSAAAIISAETGTDVYTLDMAMAGDSYFDAMYCNIDTLKEALG